MSATIPATSGADIDVPQPTPEPPPSTAIGAHSGAANLTHGPWLEKAALLPSYVEAPTEIVPGMAAGNRGASVASLPAAATTNTPAARARLIARSSSWGEFGPMRLTFTTAAPWSTA